MHASLHTLPMEIVYRILDQLNGKHLFVSISTVCQRLNIIVNSYQPYQRFTHLSLCNNGIEDTDARCIAQALIHNTTLTHLNLRYNAIGDDGARYLAKALKHNTTLTQLILESNTIGDVGVQYLTEALQHNKTLIWLDISNNRVTIKGVELFVEALKHNTTLELLTIGSMVVGADRAGDLVRALYLNKVIRISILSSNMANNVSTSRYETSSNCHTYSPTKRSSFFHSVHTWIRRERMKK